MDGLTLRPSLCLGSQETGWQRECDVVRTLSALFQVPDEALQIPLGFAE